MTTENIFWLLALYSASGIVENLMTFAQGGSLNQVTLWQTLHNNPQWLEVTNMLLRFCYSGELDQEKLRQLLSEKLPPKWISAMWKWLSYAYELVHYAVGFTRDDIKNFYGTRFSWDVCDFCTLGCEKHTTDAATKVPKAYPSDCYSCPCFSMGILFRQWIDAFGELPPVPVADNVAASDHSGVAKDAAAPTNTAPRTSTPNVKPHDFDTAAPFGKISLDSPLL